MFRLFGSTTSPYVRRVRIVATLLEQPFQLVNTATDSGMADLRTVTPLAKVPTAEIDGAIVFDSHGIIDTLIKKHGHGPLRVLEAANQHYAIDGALDGGIISFYMQREGIVAPQLIEREQKRIKNVMTYVEGALDLEQPQLSLADIALKTTIDWMAFRKIYDVAAAHPMLAAFSERLSLQAIFGTTYPVVST